MVARLLIACFSAAAAISVYFFARVNPPDFLIPFAATNSSLASYTSIFGSAPSFLYTLAIGLVIGACASNRSNARFHCLAWVALCLLLEVSQSRAITDRFLIRLAEIVPESAWSLIGPYWSRGVFDPLDLMATLAAGLIAIVLVTKLPTEKSHASG